MVLYALSSSCVNHVAVVVPQVNPGLLVFAADESETEVVELRGGVAVLVGGPELELEVRPEEELALSVSVFRQ